MATTIGPSSGSRPSRWRTTKVSRWARRTTRSTQVPIWVSLTWPRPHAPIRTRS